MSDSGVGAGRHFSRRQSPRQNNSHQHPSGPFGSSGAHALLEEQLGCLHLEPWRYVGNQSKYHGPPAQYHSVLSPVRQNKRVFIHKRDKLIAKEVHNLLEVGFIREVYYHDWLNNIAMVKKANFKWRMCVDFINLNRACLKDNHPIPWIDLLVDSSAGHQLLSFCLLQL